MSREKSVIPGTPEFYSITTLILHFFARKSSNTKSTKEDKDDYFFPSQSWFSLRVLVLNILFAALTAVLGITGQNNLVAFFPKFSYNY